MMTMKGPDTEWDFYLLAGVASTLTLFRNCKQELERRFLETGREPVIRELFPYGDHTQKLLRQIIDVRGDLSRLRRAGRSGGRAAAEQIRKLSPGRPVMLIGHSGGGVAAYQAAVMLHDEGTIPDFRIVQVGSPKVLIRTQDRDRVSYYTAVDEQGTLRDPISRIGSWGGWSRSRYGLWYWNKRKYAPGHIGTITLLGGHPHYFRNDASYIHPDRGSNLSVTLDGLWDRMMDV
ncbi:hypothetical protein [Paenibacillus spongiae]|uniref:Fungal lipase-like domain-containing protein n=1 Tax=Paenibacillus spongiae TaxID=2909671 RepID=A0ABY5SFM6_9BACL|nr:hypothetical protein [Paenibacillus spongiae]UVI32777.1 hypothetical protein L1F29_13510 [Paenibacillus spongiae]